MISWLLVIIASYLFFSLAFFGDKLVLSGPPNPRLYTFYVGFLGGLVILLAPFSTFSLPVPLILLWIVLEIIVYVLGLYAMFIALEKFEVSRVMTTIGALQPILILLFTWVFWSQEVMTGMNFLAFLLLVTGGVMISFGRKFKITGNYVLLVVFSSLMFSLDYIFSKMIFLIMPFLQSIIWMRTGAALLVLLLLFDKKLRIQIFIPIFSGIFRNKTIKIEKGAFDKKTGIIFLCSQTMGGIAAFLQSLAISLAPISYLAIISSLRGIQYVFLFIITLFFSYFFPKILKEDISWKIILQKTISIILIVMGLAIIL